MSRRRKRRNESPMTFFSFQDVITSVTGILILVTLLMALDLLTRKQVRTVQAPDDSELAAVDLEVQSATRQREALKQSIISLQEISERHGGVSPIGASVKAAELSTRLSEQRRELEDMRRQTEQLRHDVDRARFEVAQAEDDAQKAEKDAVTAIATADAAKKSKSLVLLPGNGSDKVPLLVECAGDRLVVSQLAADGNVAQLESWQGAPATYRFISWAKQRNKSTEYFVVIARPDGVSTAQQAIESLRGEGFDVGWDAFPADMQLFGVQETPARK